MTSGEGRSPLLYCVMNEANTQGTSKQRSNAEQKCKDNEAMEIADDRVEDSQHADIGKADKGDDDRVNDHLDDLSELLFGIMIRYLDFGSARDLNCNNL